MTNRTLGLRLVGAFLALCVGGSLVAPDARANLWFDVRPVGVGAATAGTGYIADVTNTPGNAIGLDVYLEVTGTNASLDEGFANAMVSFMKQLPGTFALPGDISAGVFDANLKSTAGFSTWGAQAYLSGTAAGYDLGTSSTANNNTGHNLFVADQHGSVTGAWFLSAQANTAGTTTGVGPGGAAEFHLGTITFDASRYIGTLTTAGTYTSSLYVNPSKKSLTPFPFSWAQDNPSALTNNQKYNQLAAANGAKLGDGAGNLLDNGLTFRFVNSGGTAVPGNSSLIYIGPNPPVLSSTSTQSSSLMSNSLAGLQTVVTLTNAGADSTTAKMTLSGAAASLAAPGTGAIGATVASGTDLNVAAGTSSQNITVWANYGLPGDTQQTVVFHNNATTSSGAGHGSDNGNGIYTFVVPSGTNAVGMGNSLGVGSSYGNSLSTTAGTAGQNIAGVKSKLTNANGSEFGAGTEAIILAGAFTTDGNSIAMRWRNRSQGEGPTNNAELPAGVARLISDVAEVKTVASGVSAPFVLSMSYQPGAIGDSEATAASGGFIYVGVKTASTWSPAQTAITGSVGSDVTSHSGLFQTKNGMGNFYAGSYQALLGQISGATPSSLLGAWGIDPASDTAWTVTNANGDFADALIAVPEPGTIALLLAGVGGLGFYAIRRRKKA